jgi:hypothetical protein
MTARAVRSRLRWVAALVATALAPGAAIAAPAATSAPPASLRAQLSPQEITVGDRVRVELEVTLPAGERWGPPAIPADLRNWGEAELLAQQRPEMIPGAPQRYRLVLLVTAWKPGKVTLPPIPVAVAPLRQEEPSPPRPLLIATPPLELTVKSVLPAQGEATPRPPAPPQPLPVGAAFWWTSGGLALACLAAAGLLLWRRRGMAVAAPAAPPLPPLAQFERALAALAAEPAPELVHTGISLAMRHLLAALLGFAAAESTTTEIDRELRRGRLELVTRRGVLDLLRRCDEVKFARRPATRAEAHERLAAARALGEQMQRELVPALSPAANGSAA